MVELVLSLGFAAAATFSEYPVFVRPGSRVEAIIDRGTINELIVRCDRGSGILSYSKIEKLYCTPDHRCTRGRDTAIRRLCNP
jgi:hypothetical protein